MRISIVATPLVLVLLAGCGSPTSSRYSATEVGQTVETTDGTVLASRLVDIQGDTNLVGPGAGAAIGAAGTTLATGKGSAAVIGGVLGAGLGYLGQTSFSSREGIEYVVELQDGRTVTLVQNRGTDEEPLSSGTPVLVQLGSSYTRVIADPRPRDARTAAGADDVWVDPDASASSATGSRAGGGGAGGGLSGGTGSVGSAPTGTATAPASGSQR